MAANRPKKPQKPLGFSKTVVTRYLAPEPSPEGQMRTRRGAQPGRPSLRLVKLTVDVDRDNLEPAVAVGCTYYAGRPRHRERGIAYHRGRSCSCPVFMPASDSYST